MPRCPICSRTATPRPHNPSFPFCGPGCKQVDLANWLTEAYRVPVTDESEDDDDSSLSPEENE
jgi:hypothetical protein